MKEQVPSSSLGGLQNFIALSVWEIAHRWHGVDPNISDPKNLPIPCQDTLRALCSDLLVQAIPASNRSGDDFGIRGDAPTLPKWEKTATPGERTLGYDAMVEKFTQQHRQAVAGLDRCVDHREYDRKKLDSVYVSIFGLRRFCEQNDRTMPEFWEPRDGTEAAAPPRASQVDKAVCQGIARTLWDEHPQLTITDMAKHPAIQRYGNGMHYKPRTLHVWLAEVDSREKEDKTGRPPKTQPK